MADAIQMREAHFPGRAPIDAYGEGGFRFSDMSHRGGIICLPSGIYGANFSDKTPSLEDIEPILREAQDIDFLLIGTGEKWENINEDVKQKMRAQKIALDSMPTGAAIRTFNVLLMENRAIAALLYPVK